MQKEPKMKLFLLLTFLIILVVSIDSESIEKSFPDASLGASKEFLKNKLAAGITKLTLKLDELIQKDIPIDENIVFSPVSIVAALALLHLGSQGKTFDEITSVLGLDSIDGADKDLGTVHEVLSSLIRTLNVPDNIEGDKPSYDLATGIFVQKNAPICKEYSKCGETFYDSEITNVDYLNSGRKAKELINTWVEENTHHKIRNLLKDEPDKSTQMIITSTLYFKGEWKTHFIKGLTNKGDFTTASGEKIQVDLMFHGDRGNPYFEDTEKNLHIIGFPYKNSNVTMYAIKPVEDSQQRLGQLKQYLTPEYLDEIIEKANSRDKNCPVPAAIPKVKLSTETKLKKALKALGVKALFNEATCDMSFLTPGSSFGRKCNIEEDSDKNSTDATGCLDDLSKRRLPGQCRIDELRKENNFANPGIFVDQFFHKVDMTVNEMGTEAAAATRAPLIPKCGGGRFYTDEPYIMFIRNNDNKVISFWATINKPTPFY